MIFGLQINDLIVDAKGKWDRRNAKAREEGEKELPPMLPLIRLKVGCASATRKQC